MPLDKYLLREATARDAGFLEVRDKSTPEEQARQEALNRQRERLLAQRADDRHRARQRALEEAKATKEAERSSLMAEVLFPRPVHFPGTSRCDAAAVLWAATPPVDRVPARPEERPERPAANAV